MYSKKKTKQEIFVFYFLSLLFIYRMYFINMFIVKRSTIQGLFSYSFNKCMYYTYIIF